MSTAWFVPAAAPPPESENVIRDQAVLGDAPAPSGQLSTRVDNLERNVRDLQAKIMEIHGSSDRVSVPSAQPPQPQSLVGGDAASLRNDVQAVIDAMRRDIDTQRKLVDDFKAQVPDLVSKVDGLKNGMGDVKKTDVDTMRGEVQSLTDKVYKMQIEFRTTSVTDKALGTQNVAMNGQQPSVGIMQSLGQTVSAAVDSAMGRNLPMEELRKEFVTIATFNRRFSDLQTELKLETKALHNVMETTALKAGYLAVSASECSPDEKATLFRSLRQKEETISRVQPITPLPTGTSPRQLSQAILDLINTDPASAAAYAGAAAPTTTMMPTGAPSTGPEYTITLQRLANTKLGLSVNGEDGRTLFVERIGEGLIRDYNASNPAHPVNEGDLIVAVNHARGEPKQLISHIHGIGYGQISLSFVRSANSEMTVHIQVQQGQQLGLQVDGANDALIVARIHPGAIEMWNRANPSQAIKINDKIVGVNAKKGNSRMLLEETQKKGTLVLNVIRS